MASQLVQPLFVPVELFPGMAGDPVSILKHQDVWSGNRMAFWTAGEWRNGTQGFCLDRKFVLCIFPGQFTAGMAALQTVKSAVTFEDFPFAEAGSLDMSIDVAGKNERPISGCLTPATKDLKANVRLGVTIELQAMPVKAPRP